MEAKELRIGNLISASTDVDDKPEFCEVRQLKNRGLVWRSTGSTDDEGGNYTSYEFSEPIPLTPELLEKAGFTKIKDGFMSPDIYERKYTRVLVTTSFEIETDGLDSYWIEGNTIVPIKHLHQLQNLYFALTGEELTINL